MTPIDQATELLKAAEEIVELMSDVAANNSRAEYLGAKSRLKFVAEHNAPALAAALIEKQAALTEALGLLRLFVENADVDWSDPHDTADFTGWVVSGSTLNAARQFLARQGAE